MSLTNLAVLDGGGQRVTLRKRMLRLFHMQTALQALVEPRRREILERIRDRELSAGEIASGFNAGRPTISQHLGVLKEAGLVTERREGTRRFYRARAEGLRELKDFLEGFWSLRLQREARSLRVQRKARSDSDRRARTRP
jgi:DNA-binding transcriptional ArsR family regulator